MPAAFATRDQLKTLLRITDTSADAFLDAMIPPIQRMLERYVGYPLMQATYTAVALDGPGSAVLRLPHQPVTALTSIVFDADTDRPVTVAGTEFVVQAATGIVCFKPGSRYRRGFAAGFQNLAATYVAGYTSETLPASFLAAGAAAMQKLMALLDDDIHLTEKSVGDVKIKWDAAALALGPQLLDEVRVILAPERAFRYH